MTITAVREGIVLFVVRTETPSAGSLEDSLRVLPRFLALLPLHILVKLLLVSDGSRLLRLNAAVLFDGIQIDKVIQKVDFYVLKGNSQVFAYEASNISILDCLCGSELFPRLVGDAFTDLLDFFVDPVLVLLHQVEQEGDFHADLRQGFIFAVAFVELALFLLQIGNKCLSLAHQKRLLQ